MYRIFLLAVLLVACGSSSARAGVITFDREEFRPSAEAILEVMLAVPSTDEPEEIGYDDGSTMSCSPVSTPDLSQFAFYVECQFSADLLTESAFFVGGQYPCQPHLRGLLRPA